MANRRVVGKLSEPTSTKKRIEWNIPNYSAIWGRMSLSPSFTFANSSLYMRVYRPSESDMLTVSLARESGSLGNVIATFSLKTSNGTLTGTKTDVCYFFYNPNCVTSNFFEEFDFVKQRDVFLPSDTLTIVCDLVLDGKQPTAKDANNSKEKATVETLKQMRLTGNRRFAFIVVSLKLLTGSAENKLPGPFYSSEFAVIDYTNDAVIIC